MYTLEVIKGLLCVKAGMRIAVDADFVASKMVLARARVFIRSIS